jgi:hypothetical protein
MKDTTRHVISHYPIYQLEEMLITRDDGVYDVDADDGCFWNDDRNYREKREILRKKKLSV